MLNLTLTIQIMHKYQIHKNNFSCFMWNISTSVETFHTSILRVIFIKHYESASFFKNQNSAHISLY